MRINQILAKMHNKFGKFILLNLSAAAKISKLLQKRVPVTKLRNVQSNILTNISPQSSYKIFLILSCIFQVPQQNGQLSLRNSSLKSIYNLFLVTNKTSFVNHRLNQLVWWSLQNRHLARGNQFLGRLKPTWPIVWMNS